MMHRLSTTTAAVLLAMLSLPATAATLDQLQTIGQANFRLLSEDLGATLSYKAVTPPAPLGVTGFDLGVKVVDTRLKNPAVWEQATSGSSSSSVVLPQVQIDKGLPFGIDIGASYAAVPNSNIKLWGAELRYAFIQGGVTMPAVAVRASYTALQGVNQLKLNTTGLDLSISKGFAFVTPYAGIGEVWVDSTPDASTSLQKESFNLNKYFVGVNMNFAVINIAIEADKTGDATSYGAKFGWRF